MIKTSLFAIALMGLATTAAYADQCQDDVDAIDRALKTGELDPDMRSQAEDMRSQAVQLCGAGNTDEGLAVTAEVKSLLAIE